MRRGSVALLLLALIALPATARADSECAAGGPGPGYRILRLDLPNGSDFFTMQVKSNRQTRPNDGPASWHQSIGLFLIDAADMSLQAYKIQNIGSAPRRVVVDSNGTRQTQDVQGPDVPIIHTKQLLVDALQPGTYYVVVVSSDGGTAAPNDWWFVDLKFSGNNRCTSVGDGDIVDLDHTSFTGGTQVYAPGAGYGDGASGTYSTARAWTVGFMEAETAIPDGVGNASLGYAWPDLSGTLTNDMIPFISHGGSATFTASYSTLYPVVAIEALSFDLS